MTKHSKIKSIVSVFAALLCALALSGCGGSYLRKYGDKISELRTHLFAAESTDYTVKAIAGKREKTYEWDGVSTEKRDFTVITITPSRFSADKTYRYRAQIGDSVYEGDFLPHPFAQTLSADITVAATEDFSLTVLCDGEQTLTLERVETGDNIGAEKALSIAFDKLKTELKRFRSKGKLRAEIYVRLTENPIDGTGGYFWYVAFVGEDASAVAILLHSDTGAVAALRI